MNQEFERIAKHSQEIIVDKDKRRALLGSSLAGTFTSLRRTSIDYNHQMIPH
jgi:hypothetical protein